MQRAKLSVGEKAFLQQRVETLHGMIGRVSRWLKPGSDGAAASPLRNLPLLVMAKPLLWFDRLLVIAAARVGARTCRPVTTQSNPPVVCDLSISSGR